MPTITSIKKQKRAGRANIFLDGKFGFGIDLETLFNQNLKVEQELSVREINKIKSSTNFQASYEKLLNFATIRPRSEKEVLIWFKKHKIEEAQHKMLIEKLTNLDLLDDKKFALWWIDQRTSFSPRGKRALQAELYQKGIDKQIISDALENSEIDEVSIVKNLVEKNKYKWERFDEQKRKQKAIAFLQRKGFSWSVIKDLV